MLNKLCRSCTMWLDQRGVMCCGAWVVTVACVTRYMIHILFTRQRWMSCVPGYMIHVLFTLIHDTYRVYLDTRYIYRWTRHVSCIQIVENWFYKYTFLHETNKTSITYLLTARCPAAAPWKSLWGAISVSTEAVDYQVSYYNLPQRSIYPAFHYYLKCIVVLGFCRWYSNNGL